MTENPTIQVYNKIASRYALSFKENPEERAVIEEFIELMPEKPKVLDIGCGNADYFYLFDQYGVDYQGIDLSEEMVKVAQSNNPKGQFSVQDMLSLDFSTSVFDGIFCFYALFHVMETEAFTVLNKCNSMLKQTGKLLISVQEGEGEIKVKSPFSDEGKIFINLFSESKLVDCLEKSGFRVINLLRKEPKSTNELPYNKLIALCTK